MFRLLSKSYASCMRTKSKTHCPIVLIDWTNEEGARFPGAMMASGVWSTKSSAGLEACYKVMDTEGVSVRKALEEIGYLGNTLCDYNENGLESYFELHIEQGPKLEAASKKIGVVTAVQGMKWFSVRVSGVEGHSGTTPMDGRSDAMVTTARLIAAVNDTAKLTGLGCCNRWSHYERHAEPVYDSEWSRIHHRHTLLDGQDG